MYAYMYIRCQNITKLSKSDDTFYWIIIIKRSNDSFSDLKWLRNLGAGPWAGTEGHETAKVGTGLNQFTIKHDISQNSVHINGVVQQFTVVRGGWLPPSFQFNMLCNFRRYRVRCPGLYIAMASCFFNQYIVRTCYVMYMYITIYSYIHLNNIYHRINHIQIKSMNLISKCTTHRITPLPKA